MEQYHSFTQHPLSSMVRNQRVLFTGMKYNYDSMVYTTATMLLKQKRQVSERHAVLPAPSGHLPITQLPVMWKHGQSLGAVTGILSFDAQSGGERASFRLADVLFEASQL